MKTTYLKAAGAAVSLLIASSPALANVTGPETLGGFPVAVDAFTFTCPAGTFFAQAIVADDVGIFNGPALMRVILTKLAAAPVTAPQAQDPVEGGAASPGAVVFGGAGSYRAMFLKTAAGAEDYAGTITCHDNNGVPINPAAIPPLPAAPQFDQQVPERLPATARAVAGPFARQAPPAAAARKACR